MAKRTKGGVKAEVTKIGKAVSPKGIVAWAFLDKPAEGLDRDKHKITLFFDKADPEFKAFYKQLQESEAIAAKEAGSQPAATPSCVKAVTEKEMAKVKGVKIGDPFVEFSSAPREDKKGEIIPVPVVGPDAKATDKTVWGGDIARVQCSICGWTQPGKRGLKCYLNGVQLLKSNNQGGSGTDMFSADSAFAVDEDANPPFTPDQGDQEQLNDLFGDK